MICSSSFQKYSRKVLMAVSCSTKASLKSIMQLSATHLRQESTMEPSHAAGRPLALINISRCSTTPPSIILDNSSSQNLLWPYDGLSGFSSSSNTHTTLRHVALRPTRQTRHTQNYQKNGKTTSCCSKTFSELPMQSRVQGSVYKSFSWALSGFYSSSSHLLCAFPKLRR